MLKSCDIQGIVNQMLKSCDIQGIVNQISQLPETASAGICSDRHKRSWWL